MTLPIIIAIVVAVVAFGVWLHFSVDRTLGQQLEALGQSACPLCGACYGSAAAERAREEYLTRCHTARREHPDLKINFARFWEVSCPQCGAKARFHYETGKLVAPVA
jgi:heterodisulfide reductase subunit C